MHAHIAGHEVMIDISTEEKFYFYFLFHFACMCAVLCCAGKFICGV